MRIGDKKWFSIFLVIGIGFIFTGFPALYPLAGKPYTIIGAQWGDASWLIGVSLLFLVEAWFVASANSGRVLRACAAIGIASIVASAALSGASLIDPMIGLSIGISGLFLIGGSVLPLFVGSRQSREEHT